MYTMNANMSRKKPLSHKSNNMFQIRLSDEELERYIEILRRAEKRQPRAGETDVNRRLLGLDEDTDGLVTDEDVLYFQGRTKKRMGNSGGTRLK
jgi:hypothetical protein